MHHYQPIHIFLVLLKKEGFKIGVDTYLQLIQLLKDVPPNSNEEAYSDYLSSLIAKTEEQQDRFAIFLKNMVISCQG